MPVDQASYYLMNRQQKTFQKGTFTWWKSLLSDVGPKIINLIEMTIIPAIDTLCVRAFGNSYTYDRVGADLLPLFSEAGGKNIFTGFSFKMLVNVNIIKGFDGNPDLIKQDEAFFIEGLRAIPGIEITDKSAIMDTKNGRMIFSLNILLGTV